MKMSNVNCSKTHYYYDHVQVIFINVATQVTKNMDAAPGLQCSDMRDGVKTENK